MVWQKPQQVDERVNPESFVSKTINNVIDYDMECATGKIDIINYENNFTWLVNSAESACKGAGLIKVRNSIIDFENLAPEEIAFMEAARNLFRKRYDKNPATAEASIERMARSSLEEIVSGVYDAKRNNKEAELRQLVAEGKLAQGSLNLELARYRFQLLIEAAEAKKTIRKEMNQ
jgi:hypothetical protein